MKFGEMDPMHVPTDRQRGIIDPWQVDSDDEPWVCPSCGERPAPKGFRCSACQASIEHDRLERESNR